MNLYVCWDQRGGDWHHCAKAHHAVQNAGHEPKIVRTYGWGRLPSALNPGRKHVRELTGEDWVPVLELDDGEVIAGTDNIVAWAAENPASAGAKV